MKSYLKAPLALLSLGLTGLLAPNQALAQAQPAYLEVVPLTIQWNRQVSAITRTRTTDVPVNLETFIDPDPQALLSTDTVRPIRDLPLGNHSAFLSHLNQAYPIVRDDGDLDWDFSGNRNYHIELLAVRLPARSVKEFAENRYHLYMTTTDRRNQANPYPTLLVDDFTESTSSPVDTGLTLTLGKYFKRTIETFDNTGKLSQATGSISTSFKVDYSATYYPNLPSLLPRRMFLMNGRGTGIYTMRTVKLNTNVGTTAYLAPNATTLRGVGYYAHDYYESTTPPFTPNYTYLGLAPVTIVLGSAKYISRERFPDFGPPNAPSDLVATADSDTQITLTWLDGSANESGFQIERSTSSGGPWSIIALVPEDFATFADDTAAASTEYFYRIRAFNSFGTSTYTAEANATTLAPPPPPTVP